jgi:hypothetical protein
MLALVVFEWGVGAKVQTAGVALVELFILVGHRTSLLISVLPAQSAVFEVHDLADNIIAEAKAAKPNAVLAVRDILELLDRVGARAVVRVFGQDRGDQD